MKHSMTRKIVNTKSCIFICTAVFHGILLFFVIFNTQAKTAEIEEATAISLIDVSEIKEAPKVPVPVKPREIPKEVPKVIVPVQDEIAENIVETEKEPVVSDATPPTSAGVVSAYLQANYRYIQKRIMQNLNYPSKARRTGQQGIVEIMFIVNMDGSVSDIAVRKSSQHPILDDEALRAVQSAAPFRKPEAPVKIVIPVAFKLS